MSYEPTFRTFTEILDDLIAEGKTQMPKVKNWLVGSVVRSILAVCAKGIEKLYEALKQGVGMAFLTSPFGDGGPKASGEYLKAIAAMLGIIVQVATRAKGRVIFFRENTTGDRDINKGTLVATDVGEDGNKRRFRTTADATILDGEAEIEVEVEAEIAGAEWNVGGGTIVNIESTLIGIDGVRNDQPGGWLDKEGDDDESETALAERCIGRWAAITYGGAAESYISFSKEVVGVELVAVNALAPRGEGTVDVIITSTAPDGIPTAQMIDDVQAIVDARKPVESDVLVKGPTSVPVNVVMTIYRESAGGIAATVKAAVEDAVEALFQPQAGEGGFGIGDDATRARLFAAAIAVPYVANVVISSPSVDVGVQPDGLANLNSLSVTVM